mmetsp:Transcript_14726/g.33381  ORF Transcript_14726/g.33381 Transcript_14726/m.33381 type:complete len:120 (-) Transcript_14726:2303-2662(-)
MQQSIQKRKKANMEDGDFSTNTKATFIPRSEKLARKARRLRTLHEQRVRHEILMQQLVPTDDESESAEDMESTESRIQVPTIVTSLETKVKQARWRERRMADKPQRRGRNGKRRNAVVQ